ncbi:MAG: MazG nucleotide pyrophosphohydrolase domain-containing protein [Nanoarchaeota archaeon]
MNDLQEKIKKFTKENNMDSKTEFRILDLVSEVGELSKEILKMTDYGNKKLELNENVKSELGDVFFSLIAIANNLEIDLEEVLELVLKKYKKRINKGGHSGSENE